jgi:hypothetical protein
LSPWTSQFFKELLKHNWDFLFSFLTSLYGSLVLHLSNGGPGRFWIILNAIEPDFSVLIQISRDSAPDLHLRIGDPFATGAIRESLHPSVKKRNFLVAPGGSVCSIIP